MRTAIAIKGGAGGTETLPQLVLHALSKVDLTLSLLPRIEQLVHAGVRVLPVNLIGILICNPLSLRNDLFTHGQRTLTVLGTLVLLLLTQLNNLLRQGNQTLLQAGVIAHHIAHTNLRTNRCNTLLQVGSGGIIGQARLQQSHLSLNVFKLAGKIAERFIFGGAG